MFVLRLALKATLGTVASQTQINNKQEKCATDSSLAFSNGNSGALHSSMNDNNNESDSEELYVPANGDAVTAGTKQGDDNQVCSVHFAFDAK